MPAKSKPSRGRIRQRREATAKHPASWEGRFSVIDPTAASGRRWFSVYGHTRAECEDRLAEAMAARGRGVLPARGTTTVGGYLESWLEQTVPDLKPSTAARYRNIVDTHLLPAIGHLRLTQLKPVHVDRMTAGMMGAGRSAQTANHVRAVLRTALNDAIRQGLISQNAAALAAPRRFQPKPIEPMRPEEASAILGAFEANPLEPVIATAIWTGLRMGELLALTWDRVDLDRRELLVMQSITRVGRETHLLTTKTRKSARAVPMSEPLRAVLAAHKKRQSALRLAAGPSWDVSYGDLVFTTVHGDPLKGTNVAHMFRKTLERAGLRRRRFHDLRHGAATLWLAAGADLKTVSALLGHSQISTTANVYTAVLDNLRRTAVDRMAALLSSADTDPAI